MSLFGGESGNCPHCGVFVRFQQQQGFASSDNAGNRLATVLTTICPNCQGVVVFIIRDEGDWDRFPQAQPQATEAVIAAGTPYSAYVLVRKLAEEAKKRIWVADPYLDRSTFALLSNTPGGLERRLLTRRPNLHWDFMTELGHFQREFGAVEVRDGLDDQHDRYIVVDDRAFLSGASIKDLGKKESVIVEIVSLRSEVISSLDLRWDSAEPI